MVWWATKEHTIDSLESEDTHVTTLEAHQNEDGAWEYAIVRWRYSVPTLVRVFLDGKVIYSEDD